MVTNSSVLQSQNAITADFSRSYSTLALAAHDQNIAIVTSESGDSVLQPQFRMFCWR